MGKLHSSGTAVWRIAPLSVKVVPSTKCGARNSQVFQAKKQKALKYFRPSLSMAIIPFEAMTLLSSMTAIILSAGSCRLHMHPKREIHLMSLLSRHSAPFLTNMKMKARLLYRMSPAFIWAVYRSFAGIHLPESLHLT